MIGQILFVFFILLVIIIAVGLYASYVSNRVKILERQIKTKASLEGLNLTNEVAVTNKEILIALYDYLNLTWKEQHWGFKAVKRGKEKT